MLWTVLNDKGYLKHPSIKQKWEKFYKDFLQFWNFPNCIGAIIVNCSNDYEAIDGKHIVMQAPGNSGSSYFTTRRQLETAQYSLYYMAGGEENFLKNNLLAPYEITAEKLTAPSPFP